MKHVLLIIFISLGLLGCSHNLPPSGSKVTVRSEQPRVVMVDKSLDKTKVLVRNSQNLIDQISQLSLDNKSLAEQLKAQNTNPLSSPVVDKLISGLNQTNTELYRVKVELREAYEELERNKSNVAVLETKIEVQTKELVDRTAQYNQEVFNGELVRTELQKQKAKVQAEIDRANSWRKKFWWTFAFLAAWITLKLLKVYSKLTIPFI
jgi:hypothetical protein